MKARFSILLALACLLAPVPLAAAPPTGSLLFFPEEILAIEESRRPATLPPSGTGDDRPAASAAAPALPRYLHLSALLLDAQGRFEVWLNGERHDRLFGSDLFSLVAVEADGVRLRLHEGTAAGRTVALGLNQTLDLERGRLFEGRPAHPGDRPSLPLRPLP